MAEGGNKRLLLCRFFSQGFCRNQSSCEFSHDENSAIAVPENVCWYHLSKTCIFGNNCRYTHVSADEFVNPENSNSEDKNLDSHTSTNFNAANASHENREIIDTTEEGNSSYEHSYFPCDSSTRSQSTFEDRQSSEDSGILDQFEEEPVSTSSQTSVPVKTYADILKDKTIPNGPDMSEVPLCPYAINNSECVYIMRGERCEFLHGEMCDLCNCLCLHPYNQQQRDQHREDCIKDHEREMELSFAVKRSIDKTCGICMDVIMEKEPPCERRFGILEKCAHIFCLSCIRKWRQTKQFDNKTIRACPECRVASDFVVPNKYWVDTVEEKDKLILNYKKNLSLKPCKYFKQGAGECPFAGACFYLHAYPDGTKAEMPPPRARRRQAQDGDLETIRDMLLWNYLESRDDRQFLMTIDIEDMIGMHELGFFSDSDDDTDYTDYLLE
ncbi:makorin-like protein [Leptotrombidium deliense]|uniref:RING-type E3 ubiquitin transferase n=1 Tax=Leptotrombidium deliense TaxID=299467 RepID=A0A443SQJ5_9ACAR|nr:makorin-like protein [Leptotrombidium deliense]